MRPSAAVKVLLAGLLTGGLIASGATPAHARLHEAELSVKKTITARLAAPFVAVGEPSSLVVRLIPAVAGATVTVQRVAGSASTTVATATTDGAGRAVIALDTSVAGAQPLRVSSGSRAPVTVTSTVTDGTSCTPKPALVDPQATPAARCLVSRLDHWKSAGLMGVGQQLNVSNIDYLRPLTDLGDRRVSVVGFDLEELAAGETYQFPDPPLDRLAQLARAGAVLSVSWHPSNPHTGGPNHDRTWHTLSALLDVSTPEYAAFWASFDAKMALLKRLQDAGAAVVFRPFHEANGDWFWWGHPDPATYKALWKAMQQRAAADLVHNIVWAYSFNAVNSKHVSDPVKLLPRAVDLAGIDSYDPETGKGNSPDTLSMSGYAAVAARVKRMAMTEVGPYDSTTGSWSPATISKIAKAQSSKPLWSMLWFDDYPDTNPRYLRQISSLTGGLSWLDSCPNGFCYLR